MKNLKLFSYLLFLISASLFSSCTRENVDYGHTTKEIISGSKWSVDYYFAGQDQTAQFSNYTLNFIGNGTLTASDGMNSVNGSWSMIKDINRNDILQMTISEAHFPALNNQWTINQTQDDLLTMKGANSELRLRKL